MTLAYWESNADIPDDVLADRRILGSTLTSLSDKLSIMQQSERRQDSSLTSRPQEWSHEPDRKKSTS